MEQAEPAEKKDATLRATDFDSVLSSVTGDHRVKNNVKERGKNLLTKSVTSRSSSKLSLTYPPSTQFFPPAPQLQILPPPPPLSGQAQSFIPKAKQVFGAGFAPLPGRRISAWWNIDAQVEVKKPVDDVKAASGKNGASSDGIFKAPKKRSLIAKSFLDISAIPEVEEEEESEEEIESNEVSEDEEGWTANFTETADGELVNNLEEVKKSKNGTPPPSSVPLPPREVAVTLPSSHDNPQPARRSKPPQGVAAPEPSTNASSSVLVTEPSTCAASSASSDTSFDSSEFEEDNETDENESSAGDEGEKEVSPQIQPPFDQWGNAAEAWKLISFTAGKSSIDITEWESLGELVKHRPRLGDGGLSSVLKKGNEIETEEVGVEEWSGGSSLACEPLLHALKRAILGPLSSQSSLLSRLVVANVLHPDAGDCLRHVWCVRAVVLGEQGHAMSGFWEKLFTAAGAGMEASALLAMSAPATADPYGCPPGYEGAVGSGSGSHGSRTDYSRGGGVRVTEDDARSTAKLTSWLRASISTPGPHLTQSSPYFLQPQLFTATFTGAPTTSSHALVSTGIKLTYSPPYPASLILTPSALSTYASVGGVLLGLRLALRSTHSLGHAARHVEECIRGRLNLLVPPGVPQLPTYLHALRCTSRVQTLAVHALSTSLRACAEGILEAPWAAFSEACLGAQSLQELKAAHSTHLISVQRCALLGEGQGGAKSCLVNLITRTAGVVTASCRFYSVLLAAVDSVVGLAEESVEARVILSLEERLKGGAHKCRAHTLPCDLNILAHAAEVGLEVHRAFMHVQTAGRALERVRMPTATRF